MSDSGYVGTRRRHTGSGQGSRDQSARATDEDINGQAQNSEESSSGAGCGRTCDMFRGQHGERVVCGRFQAQLPFRRSHSTPDMTLESLYVSRLFLMFSLMSSTTRLCVYIVFRRTGELDEHNRRYCVASVV